MKTVLEALTDARDSIAGSKPGDGWYFGAWDSCTCGHIYRGAVGHRGEQRLVAGGVEGEEIGGLYLACLLAVRAASEERLPEVAAEALRRAAVTGGSITEPNAQPWIISSLTGAAVVGARLGAIEEARREAALRLLDLAIERELRLDEEARLAVLAATEEENITEGELTLVNA